jgi:hypothetical protein
MRLDIVPTDILAIVDAQDGKTSVVLMRDGSKEIIPRGVAHKLAVSVGKENKMHDQFLREQERIANESRLQ